MKEGREGTWKTMRGYQLNKICQYHIILSNPSYWALCMPYVPTHAHSFSGLYRRQRVEVNRSLTAVVVAP